MEYYLCSTLGYYETWCLVIVTDLRVVVGLFSPILARLRSLIYNEGTEDPPHTTLSLSLSLLVAVYNSAVRSVEACVQKRR